MSTMKIWIAGLLSLAIAPDASAQKYIMIAEDTFEYPAGSDLGGLDGGTGWLNPWWSGQGGNGGQVTTPGFDNTGEKLSQVVESEGNYRKPDPGPHADITENDLFGKDDTTIWITFRSVKQPNSADDYGGLSLFHQFVGEFLFMGGPYQQGEWGIEQTGIVGANTALGSDVTVLANLVFRIDFLPGQERARMWIDPVDAHPDDTIAADVDVLVEDFRWNEIRFESGGGGDPVGWDFDMLRIEKQIEADDVGTNYCGPANLNSSGQSAVISAFGSDVASANNFQLIAEQCPPNKFAYFLGGMTAGFAANPGGSQGNLCLSGQIARFNGQIGSTNSSGSFAIDVDLTSIPLFPPVAVQAGETCYWQCWYRDNNPTPTSNFTDGLQVTFP